MSDGGRSIEKGSDLTDQDLVDHIVSRVVWVSTKDFTKFIPSHCIDGREQCAIVGAPGGEAGEFLIMLAAIEKVLGQELSQGLVDNIFNSFVQWNGHFYLHADSEMLEQLSHELRADAHFADYFAGQLEENALYSLEQFVRLPTTSLQEVLLSKLIAVLHLGCSHLRLLRQFPAEYGMRAEMVVGFLQSFYRALWRGEDVHWGVLRGKHAERAIVNIYVADTDDVPMYLPLVCPYCHGEQVFVNHPQAEKLIVSRMYDFVMSYFGTTFSIQREAFIGVATDLLQRHIGATYGHVAKGLPIYDAYLTRDGGCTVTMKGKV